MLLIVVRHGESENCPQRVDGQSTATVLRTQQEYDSRKSPDPHLSEQGRRQARRVAEYRSVYINPENGAMQSWVDRKAHRRSPRCIIADAASASNVQAIAEAFSCGVKCDSHENKGCWSGSTGPAKGRQRR